MSDGELGEKIGRRIARHKMAKHFRTEIKDGNFTFSRDEESIKREQALDGVYVIRTSEPADKLSAADAVRAYKSLGNVEKSFRTFKGVDILVRPIRHRATDRVKAHVFLCMLTYYVEWHMRRALSTLMYAEDDLPAARANRDPVAKAAPTAEAKRKKATGLSRDGFPLNGWRGIIATLGTISRTTIEVGGTSVVMDTEPTEHQARIFGLLAADTPVWKWRRSQKPERVSRPSGRATP